MKNMKDDEMKNDVLQYSIDVRDPIDEHKIIQALEKARIEVLGISWKAAWTDEDYEKGRPPYDSD